MQEDQAEKVEYISYEALPNPAMPAISQSSLELGFNSKEWFIQFQTITSLRQANKHYSSIFLNELLPKNSKSIVAQVENLRSNNSKEALTLLAEVFEHQRLEKVQSQVIRPIASTLFVKSVSEKGFLKTQALRAINCIPNNWNPYFLEELCEQTQSQNGVISELAIKVMCELLENNKVSQVDGKFLKNLSLNLNGKRAVVQKKAKEILRGLKIRTSEEHVVKIIEENSKELLEEESNTLRKELKREEEDKSKNNGGLKQFLKSKKLEK